MGAYLVSQDGTVTIQFDVVSSESWDGDAEITDYHVEQGADITDNIRPATRVCNLTAFLSMAPIKGNSFLTPVLMPSQIVDPGPQGQVPSVTIGLIVPEWDNGIQLRSTLALAGDLIGGLAGSAGGQAAVGTEVGGAVGMIVGALLASGVSVPTPFAPTIGLDPTAPQIGGAMTYQWPAGFDFVSAALSQLRVWKDNGEQLQVVGSKETLSPMCIEKFSYVADEDTGTGRVVTLTLRQINIVTTSLVATPSPSPSVPRATQPVNAGNQQPTPLPAVQSILRQLQATQQIQATLGGPPISPPLP